MAKNTATSTFRKIDVDQFNEDTYKEEDGTEPHSPPVGPDEHEIRMLLNQGKTADALRLVLRSVPVATKNPAVKEAAFSLVLRVLLSVKTSEIERVVNTLDQDLIDLLMKYIYRGFEYPSEGSSAHLLAWHEKVYAVGGLGSIVRVLTDRRRV